MITIGVIVIHFLKETWMNRRFRFASFSLIRLINYGSFLLHDNVLEINRFSKIGYTKLHIK